ncbi:hypothetical protein JOB18_019008 [Solea senegalensis]|uniref:Uncharacterized protein n=1 Tax=Solea senegalensis TaxID=28829 RepID=A0AAV6Q053_SOLSE|nr:hypothetical protein JOB18_019008 [Solea senegalensis]
MRVICSLYLSVMSSSVPIEKNVLSKVPLLTRKEDNPSSKGEIMSDDRHDLSSAWCKLHYMSDTILINDMKNPTFRVSRWHNVIYVKCEGYLYSVTLSVVRLFEVGTLRSSQRMALPLENSVSRIFKSAL